jgi:hypothetical protein
VTRVLFDEEIAARYDETSEPMYRNEALVPAVDLMARLAGMTLRERWGGWNREPFTDESPSHVSVWTKPGE